MDHEKQHRFILNVCERFQELTSDSRVVAIGPQDTNRLAEILSQCCNNYLAIDIQSSQDIDLLIPRELYEISSGWATVVISTECLEQTSIWEDVLANIIRITSPGGLAILTLTRLDRRTKNEAIAESESSHSINQEYRLSSQIDLLNFAQECYFSDYGFEMSGSHNKIYFWGLRNNTHFWGLRSSTTTVLARPESTEALENHLARVQIQLEQAEEKAQYNDKLRVDHIDLQAQLKSKEEQLQEIGDKLASTLELLANSVSEGEMHAQTLELLAARTSEISKVQSRLVQKTEEAKHLQKEIHRKEQQSHGLLEQLADIRLDCDRAIDSAELATLRCRSFELESERFRTERDQLLQINSEYRRQCHRAVDLLYRIKAFSMTTDAVESQGSSR
ncbi:hypothetical protein VB716_02245 [Synechococcus sp. CCY9201]|uniref:hypothetical protein n=1 Tax=Synechococcus sp. CCY9201 TaxID=174697 RepID=UPI002B1F6B54|nr:hypothetical protein [Synechococcus sp. CCY9201]MEA5473039.1 hypothetical protein [Synechococcus sp. CCY9201]